ncbi:MAG: hypothetical protein LBS58_00570, partial [Coriobacteriales bacterium]|nr:hypothetical protein [Coriobacteriales bacterium]
MLARKKLCVALGCVAVLLAAAVLALSLNACGTRDALFKSPEATWRSASTSLLAPKGPFATALALVDKSMASASLQVKERLEQLEAEKAEAERVAAEGEALIEGENNDEGESGEGGGSGSGSGGTSGGSGSGSSGGGSGGSSGGSGGSSGGGGTV